MAHTETMLESKEIFNGRVIRVTVDKVQLEDGTTSTREIVTTTAAPASCLWTPTAA